MSTAVAIMLLEDFARPRGGRGTWLLAPGAPVAAEVIDAWDSNAAMDPVEWFADSFSYHLGLLDGVARPDEVVE